MKKISNGVGMMTTLAFTKCIEVNINTIRRLLGNNSTIAYREFENNENGRVKFCVIYDSAMCKGETISEDIIRPILYSKKVSIMGENELCKVLVKNILITTDFNITSDVKIIIDSILEGAAVLLVENSTDAVIIQAKGYAKRSVDKPVTQSVVRGPMEAFTEDIDANISLLRRRLPHKNFRVDIRKVGAISKTRIAICYIEGLVPQKILDEVNKRLSEIEIDGVLGSNYIDELICDSPLSIFRTIGNSERPDSVSSKVLEGRLAIICNGDPFVLTIPYLFVEYFQESADYHDHYLIGTINRLLRIIGFLMTISIPAIYVALMNYHQEMIPTDLAISVAIARQGVPFPTFTELLLYLFIFELLREATTRIPSTIGQTVGILGAIVIGQAAVIARLVSVPLILVVSLTGIAGFLIIELEGAAIVLRFIFASFAMILGLYGFIFALCGFLFYLVSLRSFGVPYMLHTYLLLDENIKDTVMRVPWIFMKYRPKIIGKLRRQRQCTLKNRKG